MLLEDLGITRILAKFLKTQGFAQSNVFHLGGDDTFAGIVHLTDIRTRLSNPWSGDMCKAQIRCGGIMRACNTILRRRAC